MKFKIRQNRYIFEVRRIIILGEEEGIHDQGVEGYERIAGEASTGKGELIIA